MDTILMKTILRAFMSCLNLNVRHTTFSNIKQTNECMNNPSPVNEQTPAGAVKPYVDGN